MATTSILFPARRMRLCAGFAAVALASCGGGGGGSSTGGPAAPAPAPAPAPQAGAGLVITNANQQLVAADVLDNATNVSAASSGTILITGVQVQQASPARTQLLAGVLRRFAQLAAAQPAQATGVAVDQTSPCAGGGSVRYTGNIASAGTFTSGDAATFIATGCKDVVDGVSTTVDGQMEMTMLGGTIGGNTFDVQALLTFSQFAIQVGDTTLTTDGDMNLGWDYSGAGNEILIARGDKLQNATSAPAGSHSDAWRQYRQQLTLANGNVAIQFAATVTTSWPALSATPVSYQLSGSLDEDSTGHFTAGMLTALGANSRLDTGVAAGQVDVFSLNLDSNGDGTMDADTLVPVADLASLL